MVRALTSRRPARAITIKRNVSRPASRPVGHRRLPSGAWIDTLNTCNLRVKIARRHLGPHTTRQLNINEPQLVGRAENWEAAVYRAYIPRIAVMQFLYVHWVKRRHGIYGHDTIASLWV